MRLRPQQYWAIIITLLFHTILIWALFFSEINKSEGLDVYEIELKPEAPENKEEEKNADIQQKAEAELKEMLASRAAKRAVRGERWAEKQSTQDIEQLQEAFEQRQEQTKALGKMQKKPQISFSEKDEIKEEEKQEAPQTVFFVGKSRVEYFLAERYRKKLPIPVYKCEGGGIVEIAISVNRRGNVVNAEVVKERSRSASDCMQKAALNAALTSVFSERPEALVIQQGRIIYQFAAQ